MAAAPDLGSGAERRGGSSPFTRTINPTLCGIFRLRKGREVHPERSRRESLHPHKKSERETKRERSFSFDFTSLSFCFSFFRNMFEFQNLEVYKKAKTFHLDCKNIILSKKLDSYVKDQLGRASFSIILNIAEGSGKFSKPDRRNYFVTSRGSVFECVAILDILSDQKIMSDEEVKNLINKADELSRILYTMIKNLS
jgi:four helix bundle protein